MAKSRSGTRTSGRQRAAGAGRSGGETSKRLPFLLLQAVAGTALLGFALVLDSLPLVPVLAFVLFAGGVTALPELAGEQDELARRRY